MLRDLLAPALLRAGDVAIDDIDEVLAFVRGNPMAKAALIDAFLDAELRADGVSLASWLGAERDRVACGVSVGIADSTEQLLDQVDGYLAEGYRRIKLKIEPGIDVERVAAVRVRVPRDRAERRRQRRLRSRATVEVFRALDEFGLLMIEQPLHHEDLVRHAALQRAVRTDICLDESIRSAAHAEAALELGSCRIVNVKQGRVGGVPEARRVHDVCRAAGVPVWCGGMLETGIGRAQNLASPRCRASRCPGTRARRLGTSPTTSPSRSRWPPTARWACPSGPGIGVEPRPDRLEETTIRIERVGGEVDWEKE